GPRGVLPWPHAELRDDRARGERAVLHSPRRDPEPRAADRESRSGDRAPIAGGFAAAALLTRIKLKPSALSFAALGIFFFVSLGGILGGLAAEGVVLAARGIGVFAAEAQATILLGFLLVFAALALWTVTRLAAAFRL